MFDKLRIFLEETFSGAEKDAAAFIDALVTAIVSNGGAVLMTAAANAVAAAESSGGTSDEKFAAASAAVISSLKSAGEPVVINAVNGAIEAAVAQAAANKPAGL